MEELLLEFLKKGTEERKANGTFPFNLSRMELNRKIDQSLNSLYKQGKIKVGDTINDKYIEVL